MIWTDRAYNKLYAKIAEYDLSLINSYTDFRKFPEFLEWAEEFAIEIGAKNGKAIFWQLKFGLNTSIEDSIYLTNRQVYHNNKFFSRMHGVRKLKKK